MTTIHYRNNHPNSNNHFFEMVEEQHFFDLEHFAERCQQSPDWVLQLLEYEILTARQDSTLYQFSDEDLARAQQAARLQRDFNASFSALAFMLDLIDEVQDLRQHLKSAHFHSQS
jgi:chaperone modulatory protein CbpM